MQHIYKISSASFPKPSFMTFRLQNPVPVAKKIINSYNYIRISHHRPTHALQAYDV